MKLTEFVAGRPTLNEIRKRGILKTQKGRKNKNMSKYSRLFSSLEFSRLCVMVKAKIITL